MLKFKFFSLVLERAFTFNLSRVVSKTLMTVTGFDQFVFARIVLIFGLVQFIENYVFDFASNTFHFSAKPLDFHIATGLLMLPFLVVPLGYVYTMFKRVSYTKRVGYANQYSRIGTYFFMLAIAALFFFIRWYVLSSVSILCTLLVLCQILIAYGEQPSTKHAQLKRQVTFTLIAGFGIWHFERKFQTVSMEYPVEYLSQAANMLTLCAIVIYLIVEIVSVKK
jgi:hypothetical protein